MNNENQIKLGIHLELADFDTIEKDNSEEVQVVLFLKNGTVMQI